MKYILVCCQHPMGGLLDKPGRWVGSIVLCSTEAPDEERFITIVWRSCGNRSTLIVLFYNHMTNGAPIDKDGCSLYSKPLNTFPIIKLANISRVIMNVSVLQLVPLLCWSCWCIFPTMHEVGHTLELLCVYHSTVANRNTMAVMTYNMWYKIPYDITT